MLNNANAKQKSLTLITYNVIFTMIWDIKFRWSTIKEKS